MEELKQNRSKERAKATRSLNRLKTLYQTSDVNPDDLAYAIHINEKQLILLEQVGEKLEQFEIADDSSHVQELEEAIFKSKRLLERLEGETATPPCTEPQRKFKLNLNLPKYSGDLLTWPEFWELYSAAVHQNTSYSPVEKFVFLRGHLAGEAARSIQGLATTEANYSIAIDILKERFGRQNVRKENLMANLLSLQGVTNPDDLKSLRRLIDDLTANIRALEALDTHSSSYGELLLPVLKSKIPEAWRLQWARTKTEACGTAGLSEFDRFMRYLQDEMRIREEATQVPCSKEKQNSQTNPAAPPVRSVTSTLNSQQTEAPKRAKWECKACGQGQHGLTKCDRYRQMNVENRWEIVKKSGLCFQCLGPHRARDCKSKSCPICGQRHHTSLHHEEGSRFSSRPASRISPHAAPFIPSTTSGTSAASASNQTQASSQSSQERGRPSQSHRFNTSAQVNNRFYQTAVVEAAGPKGRCLVRVLIDGGSDNSYVRSSLAEKLGLPIHRTDIFACTGFQEKIEEARPYNLVSISLRSRFDNDPVELKLYSTDLLCSALSSNSELPKSPLLPEKMADDFREGPIDILIGIDHIYDVVLWDQIELDEGLRAVETVFGYVLHGRHCNSITEQPRHYSYHCRTVEAMWSLDSIGITASDEASTERALPTPKWSKELARYEMDLAWKSDLRPVSNLSATKVRTVRMEAKLDHQSTDKYQTQLNEMIKNDVIEYVTPSISVNPQTFRGAKLEGVECTSTLEVSQENKNKTLNRSEVAELGEEICCPRASDGSVITHAPDLDVQHEEDTSDAFFLPHHGVNRNGKLRIVFDGSAKDGVGRSLNDYLEPGENLLLKLPEVVLNFRKRAIGCQTDIKSAFHQISVTEKDRRYLQFLWSDLRLRFTRVPFGLSCSPFMLLKTIDVHLENYAKIEPDLCDQIRTGVYMDDICTSFHSAEEAEEGMAKMEKIFVDANMPLHKSRKTGDSKPEAKILGLLWRTEDDQLGVIIPKSPCPTTKRELLSAVSKTFDPLGVLSPWLIRGKALFQQTWMATPAVKWDDPLQDKLQKEVEAWWNESHHHITWFPRSLSVCGREKDINVFHVFCDASKQAYCAAVYVVNSGISRLVMAKSRLAPLDPKLTIPRMELMAALIGARLMKFIQEALKIHKPTVVFWTDSTDVLFWIWHDKPRKTFVENRVSTILKLSQADQWRHVKGTDNPADLGTRGMALSTVSVSEKWWTGPPHIKENTSYPDVGDISELSPEAKKEIKSEMHEKLTTASTSVTSLDIRRERLFDVTGCSKLKQVIDRTAWAKRFVHNARHKMEERRRGPLTSEERQHALQFWIQDAQRNAYHAELSCLMKRDLLPPGSPLQKMRPQLNEIGILCAVPRTNEPPLPILPEFSYITTLIIDEAHQRCFHQNTRVTLALLSAEYMVRRRSVQRVVSTCTRCKRYKGLCYQPADGKMPSFRTEPSRPFSKIGVDFFGPLYVKEGSKVWVLLFTCATSRAVHLELIKSQNTEDVKRALRTFFALRSTPELIYSDNAKTFHALLSHLPRNVKWRFIPEAAPWWGGFWERMVGVTKKCLKITLHQCHLSFEELAVTLHELAFHLNLRPLTQSDDELLTPAHLLFGVSSIRGVISNSGIHMDSVDRAWRHRRRVGDHLIRRWTKEYIAALRCWTVSPRGRPVRIPAAGDVVLVHGEGPRGRWPLAKVEALITGPDGESRAAVILMRGKRTRRPLSKLFQLEATSFAE